MFVATSRPNAEALVTAFAEFGFASLNLKPDDFLDPDTIVEIGREPIKIQVLTGIDGVTFERCRQDRVIVEMSGVKVPFIGFDSLVANKTATPRAKDKIDLEELRRIRDEKNRNDDQSERGPRP